MNVIEVLEAARARVKKGWTQGEFARDAGLEVYERDAGAVCWCASGALYVAGAGFGSTARALFGKAIGTGEIVPWNDTTGRTQAQVLAAFDKAIALARSAQ